uniref:Uncharacterized protein n=1 Tax=Anguilla anguilla TaxID=7936 RepID=A0A0E9STK6_ANGAN
MPIESSTEIEQIYHKSAFWCPSVPCESEGNLWHRRSCCVCTLTGM